MSTSPLTFWYLASPYSKYPGGVEAAFQEVARNFALLVMAKIPVFCPITHTHPAAKYLNEGLDNHDTWLPADLPMMHTAHGMLLLMMEGWEDSFGIRYERSEFKAAGKPMILMTPGVIPISRINQVQRKLAREQHPQAS